MGSSTIAKPGLRVPVTILLAGLFLAGVGLLVLLFTFVADMVDERERATFEKAAQERFTDLETNITLTLDNLVVVSSFFDAEPSISRQQFAKLASPIIDRNPAIQALEWVPRVTRQGRADAESAARADGVNGFTFKERKPDIGLVPEAERPDYFPVYFVEPLQGNEKAVGFDLGSDATRRAALEQAASSGELVATARITLVQETGNQYGFLVFRPVFDVASGRRSLRGFTLGVFRLKDVIERLGANEQMDPSVQNLALLVRDRSASSEASLLYPRSAEGQPDFSTSAPLQFVRTLVVGGRHWEVVLYRSHRAGIPWEVWSLLVMGVGLMGLLTAYLHAAMRRRRLIAERLADEVRHRALLSGIADSLMDGLLMVDDQGLICFANRTAHRLLGVAETEPLEGRALTSLFQIRPGGGEGRIDPEPWLRVIRNGQAVCGEDVELHLASGSKAEMAFACVPLTGEGDHRQAVLSLHDISDLKQAQKDSMQSARMASVGQLAAGIAHEINTPVQYVGDNLRYIQGVAEDLLKLSGALPSDLAREYAEELPQAIAESLDGVGQIGRIVKSMKEFSHPGVSIKTATDINHALETSLTVSRNLWKHLAEVECDFDPDLPPLTCHAGEMNQVFLNLIVNAAQAIEESGKPLPGHIRIATRRDGDWLVVRVADSGNGVPAAIRDHIFDPFYTTKAVGKGTGQGLAISRDVVMVKHGGRIEVGGEEGQGAVFTLRLPLRKAEEDEIPRMENA